MMDARNARRFPDSIVNDLYPNGSDLDHRRTMMSEIMNDDDDDDGDIALTEASV